MLGLHQEMLQADGWGCFLSNGDNKNHLIALFVQLLKSSEIEEYRKYIGRYVIIYIRDYVCTFPTAQKFKLSQENNLIYKTTCFTIWHHWSL